MNYYNMRSISREKSIPDSVLPRFSKGQGAIWKGHIQRGELTVKRAQLARWTDKKGKISAENETKRALLTWWTEQKGHY